MYILISAFFVYVLMFFKVFKKSFTVLFNHNLLICFLKFTDSENAYWNLPQNSLLCD